MNKKIIKNENDIKNVSHLKKILYIPIHTND